MKKNNYNENEVVERALSKFFDSTFSEIKKDLAKKL